MKNMFLRKGRTPYQQRRRRQQRSRISSIFSLMIGFIFIVILFVIIQLYCVFQHLESTTTTRTTTTYSLDTVFRLIYHDDDPPPWFDLAEDDVIENRNKKHDHSYISACLLNMEDDIIGLLQEWVAYHYTVLPLKRLIIATDPRARTFPTSILQKWKSLIEITEWNSDKQYFPVTYRMQLIEKYQNHSIDEQNIALHRLRQKNFYSKCMRQLKHENHTYILLTDTDEFLNVQNPNWKHYPILLRALKQQQEQHKHERWTAIEWLRRYNAYKHRSPCISVPRLQFGTKVVSKLIPGAQYQNQSLLQSLQIKQNQFMTLRYIWHGYISNTTINKGGKAIVDMSRIPYSSIDYQNTDVHRPVLDYCSEKEMWKQNENSPFIIHHYVGSYEQYSFRNDPRRKQQRRNQYDFYQSLNEHWDTSIQYWLEDFVNQLGIQTAKNLLEGVGQIQNLPTK